MPSICRYTRAARAIWRRLRRSTIDLRWREPIGSARFDFDEAECVAVVSDEIDLGVDDCAAQVAADGKREISGDESIAELIEICGGVRFAEIAE